MAKASEKRFSVELDSSQPAYRPGDLLAGSIFLRLDKDSCIGTVKARCVGRTKSKIVRSNGQLTSTSRGRQTLFCLETTVHDDKYTHKSGTYKFPFKFELPHFVCLTDSSTKWKPYDGFLNTKLEQSHTLPPSFNFTSRTGGVAWEAQVFYSIEAEIVPLSGTHGLSVKPQCINRYFRLLLHTVLDSVDLDDPAQRRGFSHTIKIKTFRLLPENTHQSTMTHKVLSTINSSRVPRFSFDLDISYHSVLEAYHSAPLPFVIAALPRTESRFTTIHPTMRTFWRYPTIMVKAFELHLEVQTECRCPSVISDTSAKESHTIKLVSRQFTDMRLGTRSIAWDQKNEMEDDTPFSIDLGRECNILIGNNLQFSSSKAQKVSSKAESVMRQHGNIVPSFTTYNVSRKYFLVWKLELECVGEKVVVNGRSPEEITIRGSSTSVLPDITYDDVFREQLPNDDGESETEENGRRSSNRDTLPAYSAVSADNLPELDSTPVIDEKGR